MFTKVSMYLSAVAAITLASATAASAGSAQTTMPVTALNVSSCAVAAQPLAFGSINQIGNVSTDSQTTVTVSCTPGVVYNVGLDSGAHAAGGIRHMQSALGQDTIPYTVFSDASRTTTWGNTVGTDTVLRTATALPAALTVYGRVPSGTSLAAAGAYSDLVTVTVTF